MKRMRQIWLAGLVLLSLSIEVSAQNNVAMQDSIPEIVVTGTGTEHYLKDAPVQTEVISGKMLEQYAGRGLEEMLGGLCASLNFSLGDMGSNIQLNGMNNDYILILINGKRMNGDIGGQNDLAMINPDNIERIEIVKGASSSLYGSDAIAGVINIITKKNRDPFNVTNKTRVGCNGDIAQSNSVGIKHGKLNSTTSFNIKHTDGWRNTDKEWHHYDLMDGSVSKTVSRSTNYTIAENLEYNVNSQLSLTADVSFYQKWIKRPFGPYQYNRYDYQYRNQSYAAGAKYQLGERDYLTLDVSYDHYNYYFDYTQIETTDDFDESVPPKRLTYYPGMSILQTSQRKLLALAKGVFHLGEQNILNTGVEYMWDKLIAPSRMEGGQASVYTLSAYAQDEWTVVSNLILTGGVRFVHHKEFGQKLTPKVSAMYKWGDFNFRATYSYGFKAPTVKELYYGYITSIMSSKLKAYYGNKDLKPQTSNYYSAGVEYKGKKLSASVTGYYNKIKNMVELTVVPTSPEDKILEVEETMKYNNLAGARSYGVDVTLDYQILPSLAVGGGYSYVDAKAQYADDPTSQDYMKYMPINATSYNSATWKALWSHSWKKYKLGIGVFGNYRSTKYYITDGNGAPYQLWRLNTSHALLKMKKWTLVVDAGIDNIFNYVDDVPFGRNRGTTTPGRTYYVSCSIKFMNKSK